MSRCMDVIEAKGVCKDRYRVYYNQATSSGTNQFSLVNWWAKEKLFQFPVLPLAPKVYHNFHGRLFLIPVLHTCVGRGRKKVSESVPAMLVAVEQKDVPATLSRGET
uniref:Uncharacterized protein n=1 Tax=Timema cristinae TaxID=61476 RepID=A0A7R9CCY7_TIMCR|nr:unnamed protein product [Timema cristinae]